MSYILFCRRRKWFPRVKNDVQSGIGLLYCIEIGWWIGENCFIEGSWWIRRCSRATWWFRGGENARRWRTFVGKNGWIPVPRNPLNIFFTLTTLSWAATNAINHSTFWILVTPVPWEVQFPSPYAFSKHQILRHREVELNVKNKVEESSRESCCQYNVQWIRQ